MCTTNVPSTDTTAHTTQKYPPMYVECISVSVHTTYELCHVHYPFGDRDFVSSCIYVLSCLQAHVWYICLLLTVASTTLYEL